MIAKLRALLGALIAVACRLTLVLSLAGVAVGVALIVRKMPFAGMVVLGLIAWRRFHQRTTSDAYGSATTAGVRQMQRGGLLDDDGMILGRCFFDSPSLKQAAASLVNPFVRSFFAAAYSRRWLSEKLIRTNSHIHIATFSPAGGGKGVAAAIPNLLAHPGNWVVVDPKGELYRTVADHRRKKFGKNVYRLDPFGVCGPGGDSLNPFDFINPDADDFLDQCRDFAHPIIIRGSDEKPHFNDMAELNLVALSAYVCGCQEDRERRHLGVVRGIASDRNIYTKAIGLMKDTDACRGILKMLSGQIAFPAEEEQSSIFSTFTRQTAFLDSPVVLRNVATSSFDPMELKTGNADLFLILPHDRLQSLQRLQRLWITAVMRRMTRGTPDESRKVYWLLDEFSHIGSLPVIEEAVTLMRGMGIRLWFIFQSIEQLKTCFGDKAGTILDNIGTQQYFGINSYATCDEISKRIGDTTRAIESENYTTGDSMPTGTSPNSQGGGSRSSSRSVTYSEVARRLAKPEEILTIDKNICMIFHANLPVCFGRLVKFFEAPEFRRRWFFFGPRGTATPRRLGLVACILAAFTLIASKVVTSIALGLAGVAYPPLPYLEDLPDIPGIGWVRPTGTAGPRPVWEYEPPRRSGDGGFLIGIQ
jgi:type IV secretion system protein VirD4